MHAPQDAKCENARVEQSTRNFDSAKIVNLTRFRILLRNDCERMLKNLAFEIKII